MRKSNNNTFNFTKPTSAEFINGNLRNLRKILYTSAYVLRLEETSNAHGVGAIFLISLLSNNRLFAFVRAMDIAG